MEKFKVIKKTKERKGKPYHLFVYVNDDTRKLVSGMAKKNGISQARLVREMMAYAVRNM